MTFPKHSRSVAAALGALILLPLACERADHDVVRGGDGDTSTTSGGAGMGGESGDTGGDTGAGGVFVSPAAGGSTGGTLMLPEPFLETCSPSEPGMGGGPGMPSVGDADGSLLIDDFEDGDNVVWGNGLSGRWESHNDETEGGMQSPLGGIHAPESIWTDAAFDVGHDSTNALHMTGSGYDTWGSGQAIYFAQDNDGFACLFDASEYAGVTFWAKGSVDLVSTDAAQQPKSLERNLLRVHLVDIDVVPNGGVEEDAPAGGHCDQSKYACWDAPKTRIELSDCWRKYVLPFEGFRADGWSKWKPDPAFDAAQAYQLVFEVSEYQEYEIWIDDVEFYTADDVPDEVMCP